MGELVDQVQHWDHEVIRLIVELVNNLKDIVLIIPGLEAISAIGESFLSRELEESSQAKLVEVVKELVTRMDINLLFSHEKMEVWAKCPTLRIDTRHSSEMGRLSSWRRRAQARGRRIATVKETTATTTTATTLAGGKPKGRKRHRISPNPNPNPNPVVDHPMLSTEDIQDDDDDDYDPPRSYPDDDVNYDSPDYYPEYDAVYYEDPPRSYPDRKAMMDKCYEMKREAESNSKTKLEALETFLRRKKEGLTYRSAIDQLINGTLHSTLKNVIIKKICMYVEWSIDHNRKILPTLLWDVEHWDHEVIRLIAGLVNNLKNVVLTIPGLEAISAICDSILSRELEEFPC